MIREFLCVGWTLELWSLQHERFELYFGYWPTSDELENKELVYRKKLLFCRPTKIVLSDVRSDLRVTGCDFQARSRNLSVFSLSLDGGGQVEVSAGDCHAAVW
jgi:hypothetical protein